MIDLLSCHQPVSNSPYYVIGPFLFDKRTLNRYITTCPPAFQEEGTLLVPLQLFPSPSIIQSLHRPCRAQLPSSPRLLPLPRLQPGPESSSFSSSFLHSLPFIVQFYCLKLPSVLHRCVLQRPVSRSQTPSLDAATHRVHLPRCGTLFGAGTRRINSPTAAKAPTPVSSPTSSGPRAPADRLCSLRLAALPTYSLISRPTSSSAYSPLSARTPEMRATRLVRVARAQAIAHVCSVTCAT